MSVCIFVKKLVRVFLSELVNWGCVIFIQCSMKNHFNFDNSYLQNFQNFAKLNLNKILGLIAACTRCTLIHVPGHVVLVRVPQA